MEGINKPSSHSGYYYFLFVYSVVSFRIPARVDGVHISCWERVGG